MKILGTMSKKNIVLTAVLLVFAALTVLCLSASIPKEKNAESEDQRRAFLFDLGMESVSLNSKKQITIPTDFSSVYDNYNRLQREAGYDLMLYRGVNATVYSYCLNGSDKTVFANLIVYNGRIIGGDVSSVSLSGKMVPLIKKEVKKCLK